METTVVNPTGTTPSIFSTGHRDGHHDRGHHDEDGRFRGVEQRADYRSLTAEIERFGTINGDRTMSGVQVTGDRVNAVGAAGALAACSTDRLVQAGTGTTADRIYAATELVQAGLGNGFTAAALASCKTDDAIAETKLATAIGFKDSIIASNVGFSAATVQLSTLASAAQLEAAKNAAALSVQATANANALSVEATKNFYALSVEAVKNASAAALTAATDRAAILAAQAECCCELKALITSEGNTTRALINTNTIEQLRAQLVATQRLIPVTIAVGA